MEKQYETGVPYLGLLSFIIRIGNIRCLQSAMDSDCGRVDISGSLHFDGFGVVNIVLTNGSR